MAFCHDFHLVPSLSFLDQIVWVGVGGALLTRATGLSPRGFLSSIVSPPNASQCSVMRAAGPDQALYCFFLTCFSTFYRHRSLFRKGKCRLCSSICYMFYSFCSSVYYYSIINLCHKNDCQIRIFFTSIFAYKFEYQMLKNFHWFGYRLQPTLVNYVCSPGV